MEGKTKSVKLTESKLKQLIVGLIKEELSNGGNYNHREMAREEIVYHKKVWMQGIDRLIWNIKDPQNNGSDMSTKYPQVGQIVRQLTQVKKNIANIQI